MFDPTIERTDHRAPHHALPSHHAQQVNIIHDFATREEIARGSAAEGAGPDGVVRDEQVGAAVVDCRSVYNPLYCIEWEGKDGGWLTMQRNIHPQLAPDLGACRPFVKTSTRSCATGCWVA